MKKNVGAILLFLVLTCLYNYRLFESMNMDSDFARDLYAILKLARGDLSLLGPPLTGGVFAGPWYYYIFVPALVLGRLDPNLVLIANSLFFAMSILLFYVTLSNIWGIRIALFSSLILGLSNVFLEASRHPGNAYSYLPILLLTTLIGLRKRVWNNSQSFFWGILAGFTISFHPSVIIIFLPMLGIIYHRHKSVSNLFWTIFGVLLPFVPLLIFELRNEYLITKVILSGKFATLVREKSIQNHYLTPVRFVSLLIFIVYVAKSKKTLLLAAMTLMSIFLLPIDLYAPASLPIERYETISKYIIKNNLASKTKPFNIISVADEFMKVTSGYEYRFWLLRYGIDPLPPTNYPQAEELIIISRDRKFDVNNLKTWEFNQFGTNHVITKEYMDEFFNVYKAYKIY